MKKIIFAVLTIGLLSCGKKEKNYNVTVIKSQTRISLNVGCYKGNTSDTSKFVKYCTETEMEMFKAENTYSVDTTLYCLNMSYTVRNSKSCSYTELK